MAVPGSDGALRVLRKLLETERVSYTELLREPYLPAGYEPQDPVADGRKRWLWSDPPGESDPTGMVGGYGNPATFRLAAEDGSSVWRPPAEVVTGNPGNGRTPEEREFYRRHSVDLTMRGGTTSGVVYPLAVCEIATKFRVRNVGGASAGAIAAAATAAAELGRSSNAPMTTLSDEDRLAGLVRPGFVGLADTIAWLAHADRATDECRLAQLFRPTQPERRVFAVATAVMRGRPWAVPLVALLAFGWLSKLLIAVLAVAAIVTTAWLDARFSSLIAGGWLNVPKLGLAALALVLFFAVIGAVLVLVMPLLARRDRASSPDWLTKLSGVTSRYKETRRAPGWQFAAATGMLLLAVAFLVVLGRFLPALIVGFALSALLAVVVAVSVWSYLARADRRQYGLIGGAASPTPRSLSERLAGAAKPTVRQALLPWLAGCYSRLAGLPDGTVLRFGHLWQGPDFEPLKLAPKGKPADPTWQRADDTAWRQEYREWLDDTAAIRDLSADPFRRLVNLELVTTDLCRQRPYRFPLPWQDAREHDAEQLYFRIEDLEGADVFDADVINVMRDPAPTVIGSDRFHRLPDPWNLPVIFAVRLSMSLPGIFKAIRLYRLVGGAVIRDDLGRGITPGAGAEPLRQADGTVRAEALWFSDGGITSNFPVHLFDTPLPGWPTFGLNLGAYPDGFPHQDVWLPQDWQATRAPATGLKPSATAFVGSIVNTARSWRDTAQTGMPGYRGRVAWVRHRPDEGGTNLFMPREIIASMALRGALAGARLARRFSNQDQWNRYRWMRLRVALRNLQNLRTELAYNLPAYQSILAGPTVFLPNAESNYPYDPYTGDIPWYQPNAQFAAAVRNLLDGFGTGTPGDPDVLAGDTPAPHPDLRQVPPM